MEFQTASEKTLLLPSKVSQIRSDDAVLTATKRLVNIWTYTTLLWLCSFILVMLFIIYDSKFSYLSVLFVPMWMGSFYGLVSLTLLTIDLCSVSDLVTEEEVQYMQNHEQGDHFRYIEYESLPLLRYFFFYAAVSGLSLLLISASQVLVYLWLVEGAVGVWYALTPLILIGMLFVAYHFIIKTLSVASASVLSMLLLQILLVATKLHSSKHILWAHIIAPLVIAQLILLYQLSMLLLLCMKGVCSLGVIKSICFAGYVVSIVLSFGAEVYTLLLESHRHGTENNNSSHEHEHLAEIVWTLAVVLFISCGIVIMRIEAFHMTQSRGYASPLPLSYTQEGWVTLARRRELFTLVGSVEMKPTYTEPFSPSVMRSTWF